MANLSTWAANTLYDHALRNIPWTPPATVYVALYSTDPTKADTGTEITGADYARQAIAFNAPTDGMGGNTAQVNFPIASANYPAAVTHVGVRTAASGGNLIFYYALPTPRPILQGETPVIPLEQAIATFL